MQEAKKTPITVVFQGPDAKLNPQNWPASKKWMTMIQMSGVAFIVGFGSSTHLSSHEQQKGFTSSRLLSHWLLVGFEVVAPFAGPLSESWAMKPIYIIIIIITLTVFCCWILGAALASDFGAQLVFRFLAVVCGATPFTTTRGTLGDLFDYQVRGGIFPFFSTIAFLVPMIAPVVGGYVSQSGDHS